MAVRQSRVCSSRAGYLGGWAYTDKTSFAPRLGLAWHVDPKSVFRMGGIYYSLTDFSSISRLTNSIPGNSAQTLSSVTYASTDRGFNLCPAWRSAHRPASICIRSTRISGQGMRFRCQLLCSVRSGGRGC